MKNKPAETRLSDRSDEIRPLNSCDKQILVRHRPIDNVTTTLLDVALRMCGIQLEIQIIDKIIDLVELIEEKGGSTSIKDIAKLQAEWKQNLESRKPAPPSDRVR